MKLLLKLTCPISHVIMVGMWDQWIQCVTNNNYYTIITQLLQDGPDVATQQMENGSTLGKKITLCTICPEVERGQKC